MDTGRRKVQPIMDTGHRKVQTIMGAGGCKCARAGFEMLFFSFGFQIGHTWYQVVSDDSSTLRTYELLENLDRCETAPPSPADRLFVSC